MQLKMSSKFQLQTTLFKICSLLLILTTKARTDNSWRMNFFPTVTVCNSKECEKHGRRLSELINFSINPCDNFYEFVCSKWAKKNPIPPYYDEWSIDTQLQIKTFKKVQEMLEEPIKEHDSDDLISAKKFHLECMKTPYFDIVEPSVIRSNVKPIGYFPLLSKRKIKDKTWQEIHNYYLSFTGESGLFFIFLRNDRRNENEPLLCLREIVSPFGLIKDVMLTDNQQKSYLQFLTGLVKEVMSTDVGQVTESDLEKGISAVIAFRMKLYKIKSENIQASNLYHPITVEQMNKKYNEIIKKEKQTAQIDWIDVIQHFTVFTKRRFIVQNMIINIENKAYFRSLARLLSKTPMDVIANHIHLYFIERHTALNPRLRSLLMDVIIRNGQMNGKIRYLGVKSIMCIGMNEMKEAIGKLYVKKYFSSNTKQQSEVLVKEIKEMLKMQIRESTWLDHSLMNLFIKRIDDMNVVIGYPDHYKDWVKQYQNPLAAAMHPIKMDAFYLPNTNVLSISAAYIQPPIFSSSLPYAMSYSGLGEYLAHEMYHAFGPQAIKCIERSKSWPAEMIAKYREKTSCFTKKFDKTPVHEFRHMNPVPTIDGHKTLEENISDLMGLKLAYWTFRKKVWDNKKCEVLPHLFTFTCDHLFFISFASLYCTTLTTDSFMFHLINGDHATPRLRVNEATSNFEIFNKVFQCNKSKNTNECKTCDLWK